MKKTLCLIALIAIFAAVVSASHVPLSRRKHLTNAWNERAVREMKERGEWEATRAYPMPPPRELLTREEKHERQSRADVPLRGDRQRIGEIFVDFYLGSPPSLFSAQLDTGSSDTAIPAAGCTSCRPKNTRYDPSSSSTSRIATCHGDGLDCVKCSASGRCELIDKYGDGSGFTSFEVEDQFKIGNFSAVRQFVGAITEEDMPNGGNFEPNGMGISGVAYQRLSGVNAPTWVDNLVSSQQTKDQFSICLTEEGGTMTVGEIPPYYTGSIQWTPITKKLWYVIELDQFQVGGVDSGLTQRQLNRGNVIVDSGTTLMYVNSATFTAFQRLVEAQCDSKNLKGVCNTGGKGIFDGYCERLDADDIAQYPSLDFVFGDNARVSLGPEYYLSTEMCSFPGYVGLAIGNGGFSGSILGDIFMQAFLTIHDRSSNPNRIGFATASNCPNGNDAPLPKP